MDTVFDKVMDREPATPLEDLGSMLEKRHAEASHARSAAERDLRMWRAVEHACVAALKSLSSATERDAEAPCDPVAWADG